MGLVVLFLVARGDRGSAATTLLKAGAVAGVAYVVAVPVFSAFRLDLVLVPMAAFGLALGLEWIAVRVSVPGVGQTFALGQAIDLPGLTERRSQGRLRGHSLSTSCRFHACFPSRRS